MQQVQYETSMKNIPLGGNKEYVIAFAYFFEPSVAEDPSGATDCTTHGIKTKNLLYVLYNILIIFMRSSTSR